MKVTDLDIFSSKDYLKLHRINCTTTLESAVYDLTSGYKNSMLILIDFMISSEVLGGKVLIALDACEIYDEDIEKEYNKCGGTKEDFIKFLDEKLNNL